MARYADERITLNDKIIDALDDAPTGKRVITWDKVLPGFGVRTTDTGSKTFVLLVKGQRYNLGKVGVLGLASARDKARDWADQIGRGIDPIEAEKAAQRAALTEATEKQDNLFPVVLESYIGGRLTKQKNRDEIARMLRREFTGWNARPVQSIKTKDISAIIRAKATKTPGQARCLLNQIKQFFKWTANEGITEFSPAVIIDASVALGKNKSRDRALDNDELRRVWQAALDQPYPFGPIYRMLILTGLRLNEVCDARWGEFDRRAKVWTIPASRMKGKLPHAVPLTPMLIDVLDDLKKFNGGDHLFSVDNGVTPVTLSHAIKGAFDIKARVYKWRNHDLRRTMLTNLAPKKMGVPLHVQERIIAHKQHGVRGVYDVYEYLDEKRDGLMAWHAKLAEIVGQSHRRAA